MSLSYGRVVRKNIEDFGGLRPDSYSTYNIVESGDVVLRMTDLQNDQKSIRTGFVRERGIITSAYVTVRPNPRKVDPQFLAAVLRAYDVKKVYYEMGAGVRQTLKYAELGDLAIPLPPREDQRIIAAYLDRETTDIDEMIRTLGELEETLEVRRTSEFRSVISPLFEGGTVPIWSLLSPVRNQNYPHEEVLSVYRSYGVILKSSRDDNHNRTPDDLSSYQLVLPGDVVINKMKAWQGSLGVSNHRGIVSPDYQVARPTGNDVVSRYLHAVLRSPLMIPQYRARSIGVRPTQWRLYWDDFANLRIPLPSIAEQARIADHLDEVTGKIDVMLAKVAELKSLLIERRAALITDVVTGKKEIA